MIKTAIFLNITSIALFLFGFLKNRKKAKKSLFVAGKTLVRIFPTILIVIIIIGLIMSFVPEITIFKAVSKKGNFLSIIFVALLGAILYIPSLISFPLAASLLKKGASFMHVAVFITSLTMIGIVTLPLEIKELGKKIAFLRLIFSFIGSIIIGIIIGLIL